MLEKLIEDTIAAQKYNDFASEYGFPCQEVPPLTDQAWAVTIAALDFYPGDFIHSLYTRVAGGRIGPGYGILRADNSEQGSLVEEYTTRVNLNRRYPSWYWPPGLLLLINWGCAIYSCIDCTTGNYEIIRYAPDYLVERPRDMMPCFRLESSSLENWWARWLDGEKLWVDPGQSFPVWTRYYDLLPPNRGIKRLKKRVPQNKQKLPQHQLSFDFTSNGDQLQ